ncbi:hypothetical protein UT300005_23360 [Clostridium sp. CTA-5]
MINIKLLIILLEKLITIVFPFSKISLYIEFNTGKLIILNLPDIESKNSAILSNIIPILDTSLTNSGIIITIHVIIRPKIPRIINNDAVVFFILNLYSIKSLAGEIR